MASALVIRFSTTIVRRLRMAGQLDLVPGSDAVVAEHLAQHLASVSHASLVSSISRALLSCDEVEELYADDDAIKALIDDLDPVSAGF